MAKNTSGASGAAITKSSPAGGIGLASEMEMPNDWLGEHLGDLDLDVTGTESMGAEDVRLPTWALNAKSGKNADTGRAVAPDEFWNTVTEKAKPKLHLVVLTNHKSREWRGDDGSGDLKTFCRSSDGVRGVMADGTERACAKCPDYEWKTDPQTGKRSRRCGDVSNVLAVDRETQEIGMIRVKKTAIKEFQSFYQKHFHKKRIAKDKKTGKTTVSDVPFFVFETIVEADERKSDKFTWYVPKFSIGGLLPLDEIAFYASLLKSYMTEHLERVVRTVEVDDDNVIDVPAADGSSGGDSYSAEDFSDDGPAPSASEGSKRF